MADNTLSSWQPFLYDLQGKVVEVFPTEAPFLAELSGVGDATAVGRFTRDMDGNRQVFSGKSVKHTIITAQLPAGGFVSETQTWNNAIPLPSQEVHINLIRALVPFTVTVDVERDSFDNSGAAAVTQLVREARIALARLENLSFLGDGTGLVQTVLNATNSPGLGPMQLTNAATPAALDALLPGTIWDVRTVSTGADPGQGLRRRIASVVDGGSSAVSSVTWDTAQQDSGLPGGTGAMTWAATSGIYIPGSYGGASPGTLVAQGLEQAGAATGVFESLDKAANQIWQGIDGRGGDTSVIPLTDPIMDGSVRRGRRAAIGTWDFALADPGVADLYKAGKYSQVRYGNEPLTLVSGFSGIAYEGADKPFPVIKEPVMKKQAVRFIDKNSFQLYGDQAGPSFLEDDGSMFRRFSRTVAKEADLLDRVQLGVIKCNTIVKMDNLQTAF